MNEERMDAKLPMTVILALEVQRKLKDRGIVGIPFSFLLNAGSAIENNYEFNLIIEDEGGITETIEPGDFEHPNMGDS